MHEHAWVSPFSSAPCLPNVHALSDSNPQLPFLIIKKGPQMGHFFKVILAESWGFEPQMPFWGILA